MGPSKHATGMRALSAERGYNAGHTLLFSPVLCFPERKGAIVRV